VFETAIFSEQNTIVFKIERILIRIKALIKTRKRLIKLE
jgi:hypothetical protein